MKSPTLPMIIFAIFITSCQTESTLPPHYNPKASAYNMQLGLAYLKQGNRQRAKQKLLMAIDEAPDSPYANEALAYYFENTQEINQAEYYYQKALQLAPQSGAILNNYATFLCRQKKYQEANDYYLKAVSDLNYLNTALAYENAGICSVAANHTEEAKKYFKKALAQDPSLKGASEELSRL